MHRTLVTAGAWKGVFPARPIGLWLRHPRTLVTLDALYLGLW